MSKSDDRQRITFRENVIHVGVGFAAKERPHVWEALSNELNQRPANADR